MNDDALSDIKSQALSLSRVQRAELIRILVDSLDEDISDDPAEVQVLWDQEIVRRVEGDERGEMDSIPASEFLEQLRRRRSA